MYDTVHFPEERVQEVGSNVPPKLLSFHDTMPVGMVGRVEMSDIRTVSCTCDPRETVSTDDVTVLDVKSDMGEFERDVLLE